MTYESKVGACAKFRSGQTNPNIGKGVLWYFTLNIRETLPPGPVFALADDTWPDDTGQKWYNGYRKTSNISRTSVGNKIIDHSDVVGASPVGAAPTTSSFST